MILELFFVWLWEGLNFDFVALESKLYCYCTVVALKGLANKD